MNHAAALQSASILLLRARAPSRIQVQGSRAASPRRSRVFKPTHEMLSACVPRARRVLSHAESNHFYSMGGKGSGSKGKGKAPIETTPLAAQGTGGKKRTPQSAFDPAKDQDIYEPEKIV